MERGTFSLCVTHRYSTVKREVGGRWPRKFSRNKCCLFSLGSLPPAQEGGEKKRRAGQCVGVFCKCFVAGGSFPPAVQFLACSQNNWLILPVVI